MIGIEESKKKKKKKNYSALTFSLFPFRETRIKKLKASFSQSAPAYEHTSLDKAADCPSRLLP